MCRKIRTVFFAFLVAVAVVLAGRGGVPSSGAAEFDDGSLRLDNRGIAVMIDKSTAFNVLSEGMGGAADLDEDGIWHVVREHALDSRLVFRSHYLFACSEEFGRLPDQCGLGPYLAVRPGGKAAVDTVGLGWMIGLREFENSIERVEFGLGAMMVPFAHSLVGVPLGGDIFANHALAVDDFDVFVREQPEFGLLFTTAYRF